MTPSRSERLEHLRLASEVAGIDAGPINLPEERRLVARGLPLHLLDWGGPDSPAIVFLHGGGLTAHTWDLVCLALRRSCRCVALDQRGHGESGWPADGDYALEAFVADIEALVDHLRLDRPVVVGQSLGAIVALAYATRHANETTALVVIDAGPEVRWEAGRRIRDFVTETAEVRSVDEFIERARKFNSRRDPRLLRYSLLNNLRRLPNGRLARKSDPNLLAAFRTGFYERLEDLKEALDAVSCPALVIRGAESEVFSDAQAERLAQQLPQGTWIRVDGAGHTVQGDNPRAVADAVERLLATVDAPDDGGATR